MDIQELDLLKQLCKIMAPSGNEGPMKEFILDYVQQNKHTWKVQPTVLEGEEFQDCLMLVFGEPKTAIFAHMDSIGYTVRYKNEIVKTGNARFKENFVLVGKDSQGDIECEMHVEGDQLFYNYDRELERGTELVFKCDFRESDEFVQSCYLDNRLGCWNALQVAKNLTNGVICFSCWEEHNGGAVSYLAKYIYETYGVRQALISDISWVTEGVKHGKGVVISLRDYGIPRRSFVEKIIQHAKEAKVDFQLEVEDAGGSDGIELQRSPYPFDWCFVGAPEDNVHTPDEKVHKKDMVSMVSLYNYLMEKL